jgi:hypothetical protein
MGKIPVANGNFRILIKGTKFNFIPFQHEITLIIPVDLGETRILITILRSRTVR